MGESVKRILEVLIGLLLGLLVAGILLVAARPPQGQPVVLLPTVEPEPIVVYVLGAVERPGLYALPRGSRLNDAVLAAGGFTETALVSDINAAQLLEDGQKITIPGGGEAVSTPILTLGGSGLLQTPTPLPGGPININTADAILLDLLPGIGPSLAERIIEYREQNGPFEVVEDLLKVPGVGPSLLEDIRLLIVVE